MACNLLLNSNLHVSELPPIVSTLLGRSNLTGEIYGFSLYGDVVVMSQDGGTKWYSVPQAWFEAAARAGDFISVTSLP